MSVITLGVRVASDRLAGSSVRMKLESAREGLVEIGPRGRLVVSVETGCMRVLDGGPDRAAYSGWS